MDSETRVTPSPSCDASAQQLQAQSTFPIAERDEEISSSDSEIEAQVSHYIDDVTQFNSSPGAEVFAVDAASPEPSPRYEYHVRGALDEIVAKAMPPEVSAATAAAAKKLPASALRRSGSFGKGRPRRSVSFADRSDSSDYESRYDDGRTGYGGASTLREVYTATV